MIKALFVRPQREARFFALSLPPLGLMYIASYLEKHAPDTVQTKILDLSIERNGKAAMGKALDGFRPDFVGLSAMTPEAPDTGYFAKWFKEKFPRALVAVGGPHPNASPEMALDAKGVDLLVLGEGEKTTLRLMERLDAKEDFHDLPGLAYKNDEGEIRVNPAADPIQNPDELPFPAWDRVPLLNYCSWRVVNPSISRHYKRFTTIFTSRSCPYGCTYCHNIFGTKYRPRSADNVFAEMRALEERYGIREFHIVDDNFNLNKNRVVELCDRIAEERPGYRMAFVSGLRGDILTGELIDKLKAAGTYQISFGIESASERIQKLIKRNGKIPELTKNIDYARKAGIVTHGFFMFGFPTESAEEVKATAELALSLNLVTAAFHTLAPYPGTPMFEELMKKEPGRKIHLEEMYFKSSTMNLSDVPTDRLHRMIRELFRAFYRNPRRLLSIWTCAPRKIDVIISTLFHLVLDPRLMRMKKWLTGKTHY